MDLESGPSTQPKALTANGFLFAGTAVVALMTFALALGGRSIVFGSSHTTFLDDGGVARAAAQRALELKIAERIPPDELREIVHVMRTKASSGDVGAAGFVLELARFQQLAEEKAAAPRP